MNSNFFKNFLAHGARARNDEPSKNEHIFRVLQKVAATKKFGLTEIFVNTSSDQNLILCKKKGSTLMSTWMNIAIFHVYAVVRTSIIF